MYILANNKSSALVMPVPVRKLLKLPSSLNLCESSPTGLFSKNLMVASTIYQLLDSLVQDPSVRRIDQQPRPYSC